MKPITFSMNLISILFALFTLMGTHAFAQDIDLTERLLLRNRLDVSTKNIGNYLYDPEVTSRLNQWVAQSESGHQSYLVDCQYKMRPFFKSEKIIAPLCYFLRNDSLEMRNKAYFLIENYFLELQVTLLEISEDPRFLSLPGNPALKAKNLLKLFSNGEIQKIWKCFTPALKYNFSDDLKDGALNYSPFQVVSSCLVENVKSIRLDIALEFPPIHGNPIHPGHSVSPTGWIPGNKVQYLHANDTSVDLTKILESKSKLLPNLYPLNGSGSLEGFMSKSPWEVFTAAEGFFPSADQNPVWSQKTGIFKELLQSIRNAKESIFLDIFFLGGTMGVSLAQEIIKALESRPGLKVFVLRDNFNHYGHEAEMKPIYNYLLAYSHKNPDRLIIGSAYIKAHRSGLPPFVSPLITDQFLEKSGLQSHLMLYGRAISDHSKTLVIDGKSPSPIAFVGSKNLTDASGAVCFDEVIKAEGPVAAVVLDDYYEDMVVSMKFEMDPNYIKLLAEKGWSKNLFQTGQNLNTQIANILKPFDLLDRNTEGLATRKTKVTVPSQGNAIVRTGMNNWDSSRANAIDEVLQMIFLARKNIYISDQLLFDRNIVLALLKAKENLPSLDIKIILEPLDIATPRGMPNFLYLDILQSAGIKVKRKIVRGDPVINQEYHMKTISMDGLAVISGSANKDQSTMYGSFREEQLEVWDREVTATHDQIFMARWDNKTPENQTEDFGPYDFEVPAGLKGFDKKPLPPKDFVALLRDIISILYDAAKL